MLNFMQDFGENAYQNKWEIRIWKFRFLGLFIVACILPVFEGQSRLLLSWGCPDLQNIRGSTGMVCAEGEKKSFSTIWTEETLPKFLNLSFSKE